MLEIKGNIFDIEDADAICVTTNGVLNRAGELVMGQGTPTASHIAAQFAKRYPRLPFQLGKLVERYGNNVHVPSLAWTDHNPPHVVSFPTKHDWKKPSDLKLIEQSARQLVAVADHLGWGKIVLTRPGCGRGGLDWTSEVKPIVELLLDDRFYVIHPN